MKLQQNNFGLNGIGKPAFSKEQFYDEFFLGKKARERREEKRADRKQSKDDKRTERQEKKELANEKRRLKNEMKQTQIDEKKSQMSALNQVQQLPPPASGGGDNSMMIVAAVLGIAVVGGVGYVLMKKKAPAVLPLTQAA